MEKIENIFIGGTNYNFLLYVLLKDNWKESLIITSITDDDFIIKLKEKLKDVYLYREIDIKKNPFKFYNEKLKLIKYLIKKKYYFDKNIKIYGVDNKNYSILKKRGYYLIEDGLANYLEKKILLSEIIKQIIMLNNPFQFSYGYLKNIKKIYLTKKKEVNSKIQSKVEIINLKELWEKKNKNEKEEILNIFNIKKNMYLNKGKNILFTQPLSEDGFLSEKEKIDLYKKIINRYDKKNLIIRPHPREKTKYSEYFPEYFILKEKCPIELLLLEGLKLKKAITIFSTAVFNIEEHIEIDFYGTRVHPKLLQKWGDSDLIMKANAFLEETNYELASEF